MAPEIPPRDPRDDVEDTRPMCVHPECEHPVSDYDGKCTNPYCVALGSEWYCPVCFDDGEPGPDDVHVVEWQQEEIPTCDRCGGYLEEY